MKANIKQLLGQILTKVVVSDDIVDFETVSGEKYQLYHSQDCCEAVYIEDVAGDIQDLIGTPITMAEEATNTDMPPASKYDEEYLWTFYKLATIKGYVTIRWYGGSNGYYSVDVSFSKIK